MYLAYGRVQSEEVKPVAGTRYQVQVFHFLNLLLFFIVFWFRFSARASQVFHLSVVSQLILDLPEKNKGLTCPAADQRR